MTSSVTSSRLPVVGRLLDGRYRVLAHIADGGMATVYLATDERLDREVAVKVMHDNLVRDPAFRTRFLREAKSAARLGHPHVVAVYDQGEDDGDMFLTMEYVPGRTLREVLTDEGPLTPRAALDLFDPVLQAVAAAHQAGLIHRDIKPENVILRDDGVVKVADFGLARAVTTATTTNASGTLLGTVAYLSPEQVERGVADARSDVYATGLVLYEMLTGRKAFDGDSPIHVAYQHVHGSVPMPSSAVPSVPQELDQLVALATARDPDQRPVNAGDLLVEVRRSRVLMTTAELDLRPTARHGGSSPEADAARSAATVAPTSAVPGLARTSPEPVPGPAHTPPGSSGPAPRRRRRRGWVTALVVLLVLALAAGGAGYWWLTGGPGSRTTVPTLVKLSQAAAQQALDQADLRGTVTQAFDEDVPAGVVLTADPAPGTEVRKLSAVTVTVSKGQERYAAPNLVGSVADAAQATLVAQHLALGERKDEFSDTVEAGKVIAQDPAAATSLKPGSAVAITVSKGRQPIPVVNYAGRPADAAKKALGDAGFTVKEGDQVNSDTVPSGSIVSQNPSGATLFKGDTVTIVVSKGPVLVAVPSTVGQQRDEAAAALKAAGFTVSYNLVLGGFFGTVRSSDPAAGTLVRKGATITLTIV